jgi:hypothetical protein
MSKKDIEYEDAYVLEEAQNIVGIDDVLDLDINEHELTLDSLEKSEEIYDNLTEDFTKLKVASELSKKKIEDRTAKVTQFEPKVIKREELVEDYIRNFMSKYNLIKSLDVFNVSFSYNFLE